MKYETLNQIEFMKFLYDSIEEYAQCMFEYGEFSSIEASRQEAKREVTSIVPKFVLPTHHHLYKVIDGESTIGHLWYIMPSADPNTGFLNYIHTNEAFRRKGYAQTMTKFYEECLIEKHQATQSDLYVFCGNTPAIELYKKLGYHIVHQASFNHATTFSRFKMSKRLA